MNNSDHAREVAKMIGDMVRDVAGWMSPLVTGHAESFRAVSKALQRAINAATAEKDTEIAGLRDKIADRDIEIERLRDLIRRATDYLTEKDAEIARLQGLLAGCPSPVGTWRPGQKLLESTCDMGYVESPPAEGEKR